MSLDIYLDSEEAETVSCVCPICENEHQHTSKKMLFQANITHNLCAMAHACNLYQCMWRPEEIEITKAEQMTPLLKEGLQQLLSDADKYKALNSSNGWGSYYGFVTAVEKYLEATLEYPTAIVSVCR